MRIESSVTTVSWIPSEAVRGAMRAPFELGLSHYDDPPPDVVDDLDELCRGDRIRFANRLEGWIEVEEGRIVDHGSSGSSFIGSTTLKVGPLSTTFDAVPLPDLEPDPEVSPERITFRRTAGGSTGVPTPRRVWRPPFVKVSAPLAWTTVSLTLGADGSVDRQLAGASPFPRHWLYAEDRLVAKSGTIRFRRWYRSAFGRHSPWGDRDSPAVVGELETALERQLSLAIMRGGEQPDVERVRKGEHLTVEGDEDDDLYLLLDGVVRVSVGGRRLADLGPGAVFGQRAAQEGGLRTATVTALTDGRVAVAHPEQLDPDALTELSRTQRREEGD
ncbi:MAG: cyclic nucleotide-binding domain-containing protein [Actinomycetota bacterium]